MIEHILDTLSKFSGILSLLSFTSIRFYLFGNKLIGLGAFLFDPNLIENAHMYKDHTKKTSGHVGIWYYVAIISMPILIISVFISLVIDLVSLIIN